MCLAEKPDDTEEFSSKRTPDDGIAKISDSDSITTFYTVIL